MFDSHPDAVDFLNRLFRDHFAGKAIAKNLSILQHHQAREEQRGEIEIVQRGDDGKPALSIQAVQKLEHLELVLAPALARSSRAAFRRR